MTQGVGEERDKRIRREILTDAYTTDEQAISWYHHLKREMMFPFQTRYIKERAVLSLCEGEEVPIVEITGEVVSSHKMFVLVEWKDREFGVPLSQLEMLNVSQNIREAVDDWHYWNGDSGRLS